MGGHRGQGPRGRRGSRGRRAARAAQRAPAGLRRRAREVPCGRRDVQRMPSHVRARSPDGQAVKPASHLAWLSLAMFFGMTLWFSATAANAPIVAEFRLAPAETAWLTMAVQGGFVLGTLLSALLNLPDIINPRRLFAIGCLIAAAAHAALVRPAGPVR